MKIKLEMFSVNLELDRYILFLNSLYPSRQNETFNWIFK